MVEDVLGGFRVLLLIKCASQRLRWDIGCVGSFTGCTWLFCVNCDEVLGLGCDLGDNGRVLDLFRIMNLMCLGTTV